MPIARSVWEPIAIETGKPISAEMTLQARIRRLQDTLIVIGGGIIAFGAWTLAKSTMFLLIFDEETQRQLFQITDDISIQSFYVFFVAISLIDIATRMFVGLSARAEGRGRKKGITYLVVASLLALLSISNITFAAFGFNASPSIFDLIMTYVIETTSAATLVLMVFCAIRLRRLNKLVE